MNDVNSARLLDGASTTPAFDQLLQEMYLQDTPSRNYDETEWDPDWYSTD